MDLEKSLKSALSRKAPPPDFGARVMRAIGSEHRSRRDRLSCPDGGVLQPLP